MFHNFPDQMRTYLNDTLLYFAVHMQCISSPVLWKSIIILNFHYFIVREVSHRVIVSIISANSDMEPRTCVIIAHLLLVRNTFMQSQCLTESSPADDRLFPSHLFSDQQLLETFWCYNGRGIAGHKVNSVLFTKALIFTLFEKSNTIGSIWCWQHTAAFVLPKYTILAPSRSWEITSSNFHHFFVHKSFSMYTNTHECLSTIYPSKKETIHNQFTSSSEHGVHFGTNLLLP